MRQSALLAVMVLILVGSWERSEAQVILKSYDTFQVGPISPLRWDGFFEAPTKDPNGNPISPFVNHMAESVRQIVVDQSTMGRALRVMNRGYGRTDTIERFDGTMVGLAFKTPNTVLSMKARMRVQSYQSVGCANTTNISGTNTFIGGRFFNGTGLSADTGDATHDILAVILVRRESNSTDAIDTLRVWGLLLLCPNTDCQDPPVIAETGTGLGKVHVGTWHSYRIDWDQANKQFGFRRDTLTPVNVSYDGLIATMPGGSQIPITTDTGAGSPLKYLGVRTEAANCQPSPGMAKMDALFDNIQINK